MNRRHLMISAIFVLAVALCIALFFHFFKRVSEEIRLPATGEAAYNPLYALRLSLQAQGRDARTYRHLDLAEQHLGRHDTLLLFVRPETLAADRARRLLDWVQDGGHLVMPGPQSADHPGPLAQAIGLKAQFPAEKNDASPEPGCLQVATAEDIARERSRKAGAKAAGEAKAKANPSKAGSSVEIPTAQIESFCEPRFVATAPGFTLSAGDPVNGFRFGRRDFGRGLVTVTELDFLGNIALERAASRQLAYQVLAPRLAAGTVHLVYSADVPSLWRLLLTHGWPVLVPLALGLVAWLAYRSQRFGPLRPVAQGHRRALLEHVQAAGEFAFRRGRSVALHAAVLASFRQRLLRREPALAALTGDTQVQALAERLQLPPSRIRQALAPASLQSPDAFVQTLSTLVQMRNRL